MPLDPNIILSYQPPQLPDVNAMMSTQAQGMQNMLTLERQRASDAAAMEAAQEEALVKAMAPAYFSAIDDPSDAGLSAVLGLVPPEMQANVKPYLDQLLAIPDLNQRRNFLVGSLASSPAGRALLEQRITPYQQKSLDIQQQQNALRLAELEASGQVSPDVAARLEFEREKLAAEKAAAEATGGMDPKVKIKLDQAYPSAARNLQSSVTELDKDIADVKALIKDEEGLNAITGVYGAITPNISAAARRAQALFDKIRAGAGFSALQAMRDASPTGGALGNVSNQEGEKLEKSVAAFSQAQDADDLREVLKQYLIDLQVAQENVQAAFDETYSYRGEAPSTNIVTQTRTRRTQKEQDIQTEFPAPRTNLPPGVTVKRN